MSTSAPKPHAPQQRQWIVINPEELVASFFLPLPEPIGIPQGAYLPTYHQLSQAEIKDINEQDSPFYLQPLDGNYGDPEADDESITTYSNGAASDERRRVANEDIDKDASTSLSTQDRPAFEDWSHRLRLAASTVVYHVADNPWARTGTAAMFAVADVSAKNADHDPTALRLTTHNDDSISTQTWTEVNEAGIGEVTVLEVTVELRLLGPRPGDLSTALRPPAVRDTAPWQHKRFDPTSPEATDILKDRLYCAFDTAVSDVRSIQRAYAHATSSPITLINQTRLPSMIPVLVRQAQHFRSGSHNTTKITLWVNDNFWGSLRPAMMESPERQTFSLARSRLQGGGFSAHSNLRREASSMFQIQGDLRVAALLFGLSAEALFDELLLHLHWEERLTPEAAAEQWIDGLDSRVKTQYAAKLGGLWSMNRPGPIKDWSDNIAELRHRVAHGAYEPESSEVSKASDTLARLVRFLCDRLCEPGVLKRYPRTALALAGNKGLARRGRLSKRIRNLQHDPTEVPWDATFSRWRDTHRRLRRDQLGANRRRPDASSAHLFALVQAGRETLWCLHDRKASLAAKATVDENSLPEVATEALRRTTDRLRQLDAIGWKLVHFDAAHDIRPVSFSAWVEEYHLIPGAGVMADGSDMDNL